MIPARAVLAGAVLSASAVLAAEELPSSLDDIVGADDVECNYSVLLHALRAGRVKGVGRINLQNHIF